MELTIELVKGDPRLRVPRIGLLKSGDGKTSKADLPIFLFKQSSTKMEQRFNFQKVTTKIDASGIHTTINATRGIK